MMQLTQEQEDRVLTEAAQLVADRIFATIQADLGKLACVSIGRAAAIVDLNERQFRKILTQTVAFGARENKVTLAYLADLIEKHTVTFTAARVKSQRRRAKP